MIIPKKINLANIPTPLQKIEFNNCKFLIKRDDYTGSELSGNKIRKLEFLLAEAQKQKAKYIFTSGGDQSNHCRATALAAAKLGMKPKLFLWGKDSKSSTGNLLLNKMIDAELEFLSFSDYKNVGKIMTAEAEEMKLKGNKAYVIPTGGSNSIGVWGYINFIEELKSQIDLKKIKGICCANGSGGTVAGMALGLALNGIKMDIYAVNVFAGHDVMAPIVSDIITKCNEEYKLNVNCDMNNITFLDGYSEEGYKNISHDKIELMKSFASQTGVILDPTYTGKAFYAYHENFLKGRQKSNILFLHTGGIFGLFAKAGKFSL